MKAPFDIFVFQVLTYITKNKYRFLCDQKHKHLTSFFKDFHHEIFEKYNQIQYVPAEKNPKSIWVFWYQTDTKIPDVPYYCMEHMKNISGYTLNIITKDNIRDFVYIEDALSLLESKKITIQFFSDILRMRLLRRHGGIWIDSTIAILSPDSFNKIFDNLSFYTMKPIVEPVWRFVAVGKWSSFCWAGTKDNPFFACIDDCFTEYIKNHEGCFEYLHIDYTINAAYESVGFIKDMIDAVPPTCKNASYIANILNEKYDDGFYKKYVIENPMAKLTYKNISPIEQNEKGNLTYWGKMMNDWKS